jgi:integrase
MRRSHDALPAHTAWHVQCPRCEIARVEMIEPDKFSGLTFRQAARVWLDGHERHIAPATVRDYQNCINALLHFFAELRLDQIHAGHFDEYQRMRSEGLGGLKKAGASRVNHELNTLSQILVRARLWAPIQPYYKPLPLPRPKVGCALADEEEKKLFRIAMSRPRWKVAYLCALISVNTTCNASEILKLRLGDIDLGARPAAPQGTIRIVEGAKNEYRDRIVPLNFTAHFAVEQLLERAREMGARNSSDYLLPHRAEHSGGKADPSRHMFSWRKAWNHLREAAGLPWLRFHDLRHHTITKLLEDENVSERTVIELAGHVSRKMLDTYSHIRMKKKLEGVMALERMAARAPDARQENLMFQEKKPSARVAAAGIENVH